MIGKVWKKQGGTGGGSIVNAVIEQYKAETSTISANTFVEFVNHYIDNTLINASTAYDYASTTSAVLIDTNKVFIAHGDANGFLKGIVCTINNSTITTGTDTTIVGVLNSSYGTSAVLIDTNKVFIAHSSSGESGTLQGIVCTISDLTISTGGDTPLGTTSYSSYASAVKISTNKVFIAHDGGSSTRRLKGIVCTVSGTTITKGSVSTLSNSTGSSLYASATLVGDNLVFISHSNNNSDKKLNGTFCDIFGTTITANSNYSLSNISNSSYGMSVCIDQTNHKVFIAHRYGEYTNDGHLNGMICTVVPNDTITLETDVRLVLRSVSNISAIKIIDNKVFVAYGRTNYRLNGIVCTINNSTISAGTSVTLNSTNDSSYGTSAVLIDTNKVFIAHRSDSTNKYLNGMVINTPNTDITSDNKTITASTNKIDGVTKTEATTSTDGDVWVLDIN